LLELLDDWIIGENKPYDTTEEKSGKKALIGYFIFSFTQGEECEPY